jgi:ABC-type uncharacterized transport system substrate-binding protein
MEDPGTGRGGLVRARGRCAAVFLGVATTLAAHPHMWIDTAIAYRFGPEGLAGFTVAWTFDELNSASMLKMYDTDGNGALSPAESESTRKEGFEHLYDLGYFLKLEVNGAVRKAGRATEFTATVEKGSLVYRFFLPLAVSAGTGWSTLVVSVMDDTFFVDFAIPEGAVRASPPQGIETTLRRLEKPQSSSAGWSVTLRQVELKLRKKPA